MTNTNPSHDLGDRLNRLAGWADMTPPEHHAVVSDAIDQLALLLGQAVALDDPPLDQLDPKVPTGTPDYSHVDF